MISTVLYKADNPLPEAVMPESKLSPGSLRNQVQGLKPSFHIRVISVDSILKLLTISSLIINCLYLNLL